MVIISGETGCTNSENETVSSRRRLSATVGLLQLSLPITWLRELHGNVDTLFVPRNDRFTF